MRVAALLEKMGWSDETEMLARLYALIAEGIFKTRFSWEQCLPIKYRSTASYSIVKEQTAADIRSLGVQLDAFVNSWKK